MYISPYARIGVGLHIPHPTSIVIVAKTTIGDNFTIYQNTTIGGAMILGKVNVGDNVIVGTNSFLCYVMRKKMGFILALRTRG